MNLIIPEWPAPANVRAFSTLRSGGVSVAPYHDGVSQRGGLNLGMHVGDASESVRKNRMMLRETLPSEPVWLNQVHGAHVVDAAATVGVPDADASFSAEKNVVCVVMTADCLPVLLCTADAKVVASAHAGWRGLACGVLESTVAAIRDRSSADIMAWLGPAISPVAFEVGDDVRQAFAQKDSRMADAFVPRKNLPGKYLADIYQLARLTLREVGVSRIYGGNCCTVSEPTRFYSFRRDGVTGRMATGIWLAE